MKVCAYVHACISYLFVAFLQEVFFLVRPDKFAASKWRREAAESGCHSQISTRVPHTLEPDVANALRGLDIDELRLVDLRELARIVGVSPSGRKEDVKLRLAPLIQSINSTYVPRTRPLTLQPNPNPHTHARCFQLLVPR